MLTLSKCISLCEKEEDSTKREEPLHDSHFNILMLTLPQKRNQAAQSTWQHYIIKFRIQFKMTNETHMIPCYSEFPAYALSLNLSDECVSTKLRVTGNHACFILVTWTVFHSTLMCIEHFPTAFTTISHN